MRLRNVKNASEILNSSKYFVSSPEKYRGKWNTLFGNDNQIMLEIGMGKGDFIIGMARLHPDWNFIGIEAYESVLVRAVEKLDMMDLPNVKVLCVNAADIASIFDHEVEKIYLNFSDPWPKTRHHKRRLTHENFLREYDKIFKWCAAIEMKTDNDKLFEDSLCYLTTYGYKLDRVSLDLWSTDIEDVRTEYEIRFGMNGYKIKFLKAHKDDTCHQEASLR